MQFITIISRVAMITLMAGIIGYEREFKSRPAGMRTHVLVGIGATLIALIQLEIMDYSLKLAIENPAVSGVIRSDPARLICQVISGIGFLGAGTIIVQRRSIKGLTTAASLWATAGLGLAVGMGYYKIAIAGFIAILITLMFLQKIIVINSIKKLEVQYVHKKETAPYIKEYFKEHHVIIRNTDMSVQILDDHRMYTNIYDIELPRDMDDVDIIESIAKNDNVVKIRMISI